LNQLTSPQLIKTIKILSNGMGQVVPIINCSRSEAIFIVVTRHLQARHESNFIKLNVRNWFSDKSDIIHVVGYQLLLDHGGSCESVWVWQFSSFSPTLTNSSVTRHVLVTQPFSLEYVLVGNLSARRCTCSSWPLVRYKGPTLCWHIPSFLDTGASSSLQSLMSQCPSDFLALFLIPQKGRARPHSFQCCLFS